MFKFTKENWKWIKKEIRPNPKSSEMNIAIVIFAPFVLLFSILGDIINKIIGKGPKCL